MVEIVDDDNVNDPDGDILAALTEEEARAAKPPINMQEVDQYVLDARLAGKDAAILALSNHCISPLPAFRKQRNYALAMIAKNNLADRDPVKNFWTINEVLADIALERPRQRVPIDNEYISELNDCLSRYKEHCAGKRADLPEVKQFGEYTDAFFLDEDGTLRPSPKGWDDASRLREELRFKINEAVPDGKFFNDTRQYLIDTISDNGELIAACNKICAHRLPDNVTSEDSARSNLAPDTLSSIRFGLGAEIESIAIEIAQQDRFSFRLPETAASIDAHIAVMIGTEMNERAEILAAGRAKKLVTRDDRAAGTNLPDWTMALPKGVLAEHDQSARTGERAQPIHVPKDNSIVDALWASGGPYPHPALTIPDGSRPGPLSKPFDPDDLNPEPFDPDTFEPTPEAAPFGGSPKSVPRNPRVGSIHVLSPGERKEPPLSARPTVPGQSPDASQRRIAPPAPRGEAGDVDRNDLQSLASPSPLPAAGPSAPGKRARGVEEFSLEADGGARSPKRPRLNNRPHERTGRGG